MATEKNYVTPVFTASYPNLFTARYNELAKRDEFSVVALFKTGEDLSGMKAAAEAALEKKFGSARAKWPRNLRTPFRDQAEKAKDGVLPPGHVPGAVWVNFRTTQKPGIVDQDRQPILDPHKIYGGCKMRVTYRAYGYSQGGNQGVNFGLVNVQFVGDGEPFGTPRVAAEDEFTAVGGEGGTSEDLFGSMGRR